MRRTLPLASLLVLLFTGIIVACARDIDSTAPVAKPAAGFVIIKPPPFDPNQWVQITAGYGFTCARRASSAVFCWGRNDRGQLARSGDTTCGGLSCSARPKAVYASYDTLRLTQLDAGMDHVCGIDGNSDAWCWGSASNGQVGNGNLGYSSFTGSATRVAGAFKFTTISAGGYATCGTSPSGMICWGQQYDTAANFPMPRVVSSFNGYGSVAAGEQHGCALGVVGSSRVVDCWGNNRNGALGFPTQVMSQGPFSVRSDFGDNVARVTTQWRTTCVDQNSGIVQCAGDNSRGQLGNGNTITTGTPQTVGNGMALSGVSISGGHGCALDPSGAAWCWGLANRGQLGIAAPGQTNNFPSPQRVAGGLTFRALAAGEQHTCGITTGNAIYCWGNNYYGELGGGYPGDLSYTPKPIGGPY